MIAKTLFQTLFLSFFEVKFKIKIACGASFQLRWEPDAYIDPISNLHVPILALFNKHRQHLLSNLDILGFAFKFETKSETKTKKSNRERFKHDLNNR